MENASKALLIAGSILIVILLIAMGVKVFTSTQGTTDAVDGTMQATEVAMFNNKFMPYIGNNKSKNDALSLVNLIIANNSTSSSGIKVLYKIKGYKASTYDNWTGKMSGLQNIISNCDVSAKFKLEITGYNSKGYIEKIYIETN